jgi:CheY-like chemotaxis protein
MATGPSRTAVFVVEDDDVVRSFLVDLLTEAGFVVSEAARAETALESLRAMAPDVIVLDLGMPVGAMQGMELLARIRETPSGRAIPVVILSGLGEVVNRDVTARLGVAAIVSKPVLDPAGLVRIIREAVNGRDR